MQPTVFLWEPLEAMILIMAPYMIVKPDFPMIATNSYNSGIFERERDGSHFYFGFLPGKMREDASVDKRGASGAVAESKRSAGVVPGASEYSGSVNGGSSNVTARRMPRRGPVLTGTDLPDDRASSEDEEVSDDDLETRRYSSQGGAGAAGCATSDAKASQS